MGPRMKYTLISNVGGEGVPLDGRNAKVALQGRGFSEGESL